MTIQSRAAIEMSQKPTHVIKPVMYDSGTREQQATALLVMT